MGYKRNAETQRRLKNKYVDRYRCPIYYDEEKGRYIHYHFGKASAKGYRAYVKKQSTRRIRRSAEVYQEKGKHHRHYDFWWELI
jgi:hypothetical protein